MKVAALRPFMENHVFILHEKVPVQRPGLQEITGTYIPAHQVRQFQPLGFPENLMPISISGPERFILDWNNKGIGKPGPIIVQVRKLWKKISRFGVQHFGPCGEGPAGWQNYIR